MLHSMTGFGCASGNVGGVEYAVEARSVNNRYFKAALKLPEIWAAAEPDIEKLLRHRVQRGTVSLTVRMKVPDEKAAHRVNTAALASYLEQLRPMEMEANPMLRVDLGSLLLLPGVCEPPGYEEIIQQTREGLLALIERALGELVAMRQREGRQIAADLLANCGLIDRHLAVVLERAPRIVQEYHDRLAARVLELTREAKLQIDQEDLAREVAIFAERSDVAEETARLRNHVEQFRQAVQSEEPAGRKLDFIAQEMLREANTISSKTGDTEVARAVVELKTAIDRIKEQVQNVE